MMQTSLARFIFTGSFHRERQPRGLDQAPKSIVPEKKIKRRTKMIAYHHSSPKGTIVFTICLLDLFIHYSTLRKPKAEDMLTDEGQFIRVQLTLEYYGTGTCSKTCFIQCFSFKKISYINTTTVNCVMNELNITVTFIYITGSSVRIKSMNSSRPVN